MQWIKKAGYRTFQFGLKVGTQILNFPEPELISGVGCLKKLPEKVKSMGVKKVLIVTGKHVSLMPQFEMLLSNLQLCGIDYTIFKDVSPNPTITNVESARRIYSDKGCDGIIAFGGGSPIDCAKAAGTLIARPGKTISQLRGYFKVNKNLPMFFAIPTTSGSGSETSVSAVITDDANHDKFSINDSKLIPKVAVLDPELTLSLSALTTACTGMDALTHAVEAYIGKSGTKYTDAKAEKAVELIFSSLEPAFVNGKDIEARDRMAHASYYAGCAFTRAFVGYVHAIAHSLGGFYNVPHGLANAIILPYVLMFYGESAYKKLSKLAVSAKIGVASEPESELAKRFISKIQEMNHRMGIPTVVKELRPEDIPALSAHAMREANPFYPVPKIMDSKQCAALLEHLLP